MCRETVCLGRKNDWGHTKQIENMISRHRHKYVGPSNDEINIHIYNQFGKKMTNIKCVINGA
jgi:hypothetical protein